MRIRINKSFAGFRAGDTIEVSHIDGVPRAAFWRRRLADSLKDQCVSVVYPAKPVKKPAIKTKEVKEDGDNHS